MNGHSFLKGAVILTIAGIISKLLGALYRIPFFRMVGAEGMGLYQMAYPLYTMLLAISSAGIPVAVSKLVSEAVARRNMAEAARIFQVSLVFIAVVSGLTSFLLYKNAYFLAANVLHDARAYYSIVAIAPAVFFVGIMSVFRGYFQGFQEMAPTALSQVLEQLARVVTVLAGAYLFLPKGVEFAAAAATFGAVTGAAGGCFLLALIFLVRPFLGLSCAGGIGPVYRKDHGMAGILARLVALALPISLGGLVMPVMQTLDALTVPGRLQIAGFSVSRAVELYGQLTGGAVTLVNLPTVLTISLAASLVPAISSSFERKDYFQVRNQTGTAIKITVILCLPAAVGLAVLASPISDLLYKCPEAGIPLTFLAPATILLGLHQTSAGILQGLGKTYLPVFNLMVGALVKYFLNYTLTAVPGIGIIGAAVGSVAGFMVSASLNLFNILVITKWRPKIGDLLMKPLIAATIMGVGVYLTFAQFKIFIGSNWATVTSILLGAIFYFVVLAFMGSFRNTDFSGPAGLFRRIKF